MANQKKSEEEKKTTAKKTATKKTTAKKTTTKKTSVKAKTTAEKKPVAKKETSKKKITTSKTTTAKKKEPVILESVNYKEEYDDERTQLIHVIDEDFLTEKTVEKYEKDNEKGIVVLFIVIVFLFLVGLYYIYDYTKDQNANSSNDVDVLNEEKLNEGANNATNTNNDKKDSNEIAYDNIQSIDILELQNKIDANEKIIVLIASKYCGSCSVFEPVLDSALEKVNKKAYKIDVATLETEEEYNVFHSLFDLSGTPNTFIIEKGKEKASFVGYRSEDATKAWIEENY